MRIGFDVTPLCVPQSGVGTYTTNLLDHLSQYGDDEIIPFTHRRWPMDASDLARSQSPFLRMNKTVWMQTVLPRQLARLKIDVCHFTNNVASIWTPCPSIMTIHDMTLWLF